MKASSPNDKRPPAGKSERSLQSWYRMTGVGFEFIVAVLLFGGIGWFIDDRLGTVPWFMIAGGGFGFAVGLYILIRTANRMFRE